MFGGRGRLSAIVFHVDYTDLQVQTVIRPTVVDISNAAAATIDGAELEGVVRVGSRITAGGHLNWMNARYGQYLAVVSTTASADVAGNRLSNAPEWSGRAWAEWRPGVGRLGRLAVRVEGRRQSTVFFSPFNDAVQRQTPYGLLDASVELTPRGGRWGIQLYGQNLADARYVTVTSAAPPPAIGGRPGVPRRLGLHLTVLR